MKKYKITNGSRHEFTKKDSWYFSASERAMGTIVLNFVKEAKNCTISEIYNLPELKSIIPDYNSRIYAVKYLLMFLFCIKRVRLKCNNGMKIINIR